MPGRKAPEEARREDILRAAYDVAARRGVETLTLRAVAQRASVSHGTVLFHFRRRDDLVATLLDRVLYATAVLRVPDDVAKITRPSERLQALLRAEMERLSVEPRHFRLFLEYSTLGLQIAGIRKRVGTALDEYRAGFRGLAKEVLEAAPTSKSRRAASPMRDGLTTTDGVASVSTSLVHGCALQALIDPKGFDVEQHVATAARMLEQIAGAPSRRVKGNSAH
jgi:TetR/AcrR family transcriptional regulator, transcriptional repressor of bet genes